MFNYLYKYICILNGCLENHWSCGKMFGIRPCKIFSSFFVLTKLKYVKFGLEIQTTCLMIVHIRQFISQFDIDMC